MLVLLAITSIRYMVTKWVLCYSSQHWLQSISFDPRLILPYLILLHLTMPARGQRFAIKGWTNVRFENSDIIIDGKTALAMGNYFFTDPEGQEVKVEYTFGYIEDDQGNLRIQLHHSSMPAESQ